MSYPIVLALLILGGLTPLCLLSCSLRTLGHLTPFRLFFPYPSFPGLILFALCPRSLFPFSFAPLFLPSLLKLSDLDSDFDKEVAEHQPLIAQRVGAEEVKKEDLENAD